MKITIEISCDDAAFDEEPAQKVARILNKLSLRFDDMLTLTSHGRHLSLFDTNGNNTGSAEISK